MRSNFPKSINSPKAKTEVYDYKNPWENREEGTWIITKKESSTLTTRIQDPSYGEVEAALARCYDIVVERIMKFRSDNQAFSASDLALDTIKGLREIINNDRKRVDSQE